MFAILVRRLWNFRIPTVIVLSVIVSAIFSIYAYAYSVGYIKNIFSVGDSPNIFSVGGSPPQILPSSGSILLLILVPIEMAVFAIMVMVFRMRGEETMGNVRQIVLTMAMAIFVIIMFFIVYNLLTIFRGG